MSKQPIKENSFDPAPGGFAGSVNVQPGYGTFASPSTYQDPRYFDSSDYNKHYDKLTTGQPDTQTLDKSGSLDKDVEQIFKGKEKPTVDDVLCGIQYELQNMIKKDKRIAKELVLKNMKEHGPKYYTKLGMLNINDKEMDVEPVAYGITESKEMQERMKILDSMIADKEAKREPMRMNKEMRDILTQKAQEKIDRVNNLCKKFN